MSFKFTRKGKQSSDSFYAQLTQLDEENKAKQKQRKLAKKQAEKEAHKQEKKRKREQEQERQRERTLDLLHTNQLHKVTAARFKGAATKKREQQEKQAREEWEAEKQKEVQQRVLELRNTKRQLSTTNKKSLPSKTRKGSQQQIQKPKKRKIVAPTDMWEWFFGQDECTAELDEEWKKEVKEGDWDEDHEVDNADDDQLHCSLSSRDDPYLPIMKMLDISNMSTIVGREKEQKLITEFIYDGLTGSRKFMYISGMVGTGKTLTVRQCIKDYRARQTRSRYEQLHFHSAFINAYKHFSHPQYLYSKLWEHISGAIGEKRERCAPSRALERLSTFFNNPKKFLDDEEEFRFLLVLDEADFLLDNDCKVFFNLTNWPGLPTAPCFSIIFIANMMTLPHDLHARIGSRLGVTKQPFLPYKSDSLSAILTKRIMVAQHSAIAKKGGNFVSLVDDNPIELASRRIGTYCGDARRVLHLMRDIISVAREEWITKGRPKVPIQVGMAHAVKAITCRNQNKFGSLLKDSLAPLEKLLLCAVVSTISAEHQRQQEKDCENGTECDPYNTGPYGGGFYCSTEVTVSSIVSHFRELLCTVDMKQVMAQVNPDGCSSKPEMQLDVVLQDCLKGLPQEELHFTETVPLEEIVEMLAQFVCNGFISVVRCNNNVVQPVLNLRSKIQLDLDVVVVKDALKSFPSLAGILEVENDQAAKLIGARSTCR
eukprot:TRINITY_DN67384_c6_g6_i1.p1 TRINITY_DN67384_c6_g6~~TRINITY_DN67384_c6_g6_i1.p1  ORF type:complete len:711 (-),score=88.08 TRINITY_DN67384_c6_g6_i1:573-2705(-)